MVFRDTMSSRAISGPFKSVPSSLSPADGRPTVAHPELGVNVFGVSTHGVQRHHELAGNFWAVQIGSEQPKHGGRPPDGCSPRAWCKCFWCEYAWCSETP